MKEYAIMKKLDFKTLQHSISKKIFLLSEMVVNSVEI